MEVPCCIFVKKIFSMINIVTWTICCQYMSLLIYWWTKLKKSFTWLFLKTAYIGNQMYNVSLVRAVLAPPFVNEPYFLYEPGRCHVCAPRLKSDHTTDHLCYVSTIFRWSCILKYVLTPLSTGITFMQVICAAYADNAPQMHISLQHLLFSGFMSLWKLVSSMLLCSVQSSLISSHLFKLWVKFMYYNRCFINSTSHLNHISASLCFNLNLAWFLFTVLNTKRCALLLLLFLFVNFMYRTLPALAVTGVGG